MKLSEYKATFYEVSTKASDRTRTAAFAGIGIVWVFKLAADPYPMIPKPLLIPMAAFVFCVLCDLLHYVVASLVWFSFHRIHEGKLGDPANEDPELDHSVWLTVPIHMLFILKIGAVIVGYAMVAAFLVRAWVISPVG